MKRTKPSLFGVTIRDSENEVSTVPHHRIWWKSPKTTLEKWVWSRTTGAWRNKSKMTLLRTSRRVVSKSKNSEKVGRESANSKSAVVNGVKLENLEISHPKKSKYQRGREEEQWCKWIIKGLARHNRGRNQSVQCVDRQMHR